MRRVPAIHEGLVVRQIGTPLTHARFLRRHRGNYGLALAAGGCGVLHALPPSPRSCLPLPTPRLHALPTPPPARPSPQPARPDAPRPVSRATPHAAASRELKFPEVTTPLPGLYRCGDSTTAGIGVPAVASSGAQCATPVQRPPCLATTPWHGSYPPTYHPKVRQRAALGLRAAQGQQQDQDAPVESE